MRWLWQKSRPSSFWILPMQQSANGSCQYRQLRPDNRRRPRMSNAIPGASEQKHLFPGMTQWLTWRWWRWHPWSPEPPPPHHSPADHRARQCNQCQKVFKEKSSLASHKLMHSGITPYQCNHCEKSFFKIKKKAFSNYDYECAGPPADLPPLISINKFLSITSY